MSKNFSDPSVNFSPQTPKMRIAIWFFHYPCAVNHLRELCCPRGQNKMLWMERFWREIAALPDVHTANFLIARQYNISLQNAAGFQSMVSSANSQHHLDWAGNTGGVERHFMVTDRWVADWMLRGSLSLDMAYFFWKHRLMHSRFFSHFSIYLLNPYLDQIFRTDLYETEDFLGATQKCVM